MRYSRPMRILLLLALLLLPRFALADASAPYTTPRDEVRLISQANAAQDGQLRLALEFKLQPGWHIYWKDPGDAGLPPVVSAAPPVALGPFSWPEPERLVLAGVKANVLSGHVVLPFTASNVAGGQMAVQARWLVCSDLCVPEHANFTLALSGGASAEAGLFNQPAAPRAERSSYLVYLALALAGGLLLNLMPCVFPVLAMKGMALARLGGAEASHMRREAFSYSAGVLISILLLGGALLALRAAGAAVFWGFQFQSPVFVALAGWIIFAAGLNFAGLFKLSMPGAVGRIPAQHSFFTGLLAVLVATPCTAPFMAAAIAAALGMAPLAALGLFLALGLGMALPVLALGLLPVLARWLPRPGRWMALVQKILAIPMFLSFVWLAWVIFRQAGPQGLLLFLLGAALLLAFLPRKPVLGLAVLALLAFVHTQPARPPLTLPGAQPYSAERLAALRAQGQPVFIDLTASWCVTCLVNERTTLAAEPVQALFKKNKVALLVGDWTDYSQPITDLLEQNNHAGVPLYLYYPPGGEAEALPQILTPGIVARAVGG